MLLGAPPMHRVAQFYHHLWNDPLTVKMQFEVFVCIVLPLIAAALLMYRLIIWFMRDFMGWRV
jgi:hypothetical protein